MYICVFERERKCVCVCGWLGVCVCVCVCVCVWDANFPTAIPPCLSAGCFLLPALACCITLWVFEYMNILLFQTTGSTRYPAVYCRTHTHTYTHWEGKDRGGGEADVSAWERVLKDPLPPFPPAMASREAGGSSCSPCPSEAAGTWVWTHPVHPSLGTHPALAPLLSLCLSNYLAGPPEPPSRCRMGGWRDGAGLTEGLPGGGTERQ